ncbi:unnamed protein product, partial [Amoebophrya sp. A120]
LLSPRVAKCKRVCRDALRGRRQTQNCSPDNNPSFCIMFDSNVQHKSPIIIGSQVLDLWGQHVRRWRLELDSQTADACWPDIHGHRRGNDGKTVGCSLG